MVLIIMALDSFLDLAHLNIYTTRDIVHCVVTCTTVAEGMDHHLQSNRRQDRMMTMTDVNGIFYSFYKKYKWCMSGTAST